MPAIKPLPWLLALLLCWQAVIATAAPMLMPAGSLGAGITGHLAAAATDDCGHALPKHCAESGSTAAGADHCGQHCKHCPGSAIGYLLTLIAVMPIPAVSSQPSFTELPFSSRQPLVIHRPPIAA